MAQLLEVRKHAGLILPAPAGGTIAALGDDEHAYRAAGLYRARRAVLRPAVEAAGFRVDFQQ